MNVPDFTVFDKDGKELSLQEQAQCILESTPGIKLDGQGMILLRHGNSITQLMFRVNGKEDFVERMNTIAGIIYDPDQQHEGENGL